MIKYQRAVFFILLLSLIVTNTYSQQFSLPFGDIKAEELSNKPYKPDPGADAIILSDIGLVTLNYAGEFYVELERDVRMRIVNSNGFDNANIEIPFSTGDILYGYRASTFNTRNGEKAETIIPKKSFIVEKTTKSIKTLKFNFADVHEGSVIEYSYKVRMKDNAVFELVPWEFQSDIPVEYSSITVSYPDYFLYKTIISGSAKDVMSGSKTAESYFFGERMKVNSTIWNVQNMPAFRVEPYIKSTKEHLTKITFELASVSIPNTSFKEITPTYKTLTDKLLGRDDFGNPLKTNLKSLAEKITKSQNDNLSKLKKIHEYISTNILWNGVEDYTASSSLKYVLKKEKGNSADINMILIAMLRSLNIKADPVILSTRSNGSLNQYSAMIQQFNYLVAYVTIDGKNYLVDATDPLRPFDELPFNCLNGVGRLISQEDSRFVDLKNSEKNHTESDIDIRISSAGDITGNLKYIYSGYPAYTVRKVVKLESEEGYSDIVKSLLSGFDLSDLKINNLEDRNSELTETCAFKVSNGAQVADDEIILVPSFAFRGMKNPFYSSERKYPIDLGCPTDETYKLSVAIPEGYYVAEKPDNATINLGNNDGKFEFKCDPSGEKLVITSVFSISKTLFPISEYKAIQNFYAEYLKKQAEPVIFKKSGNN